MIVSYEAKSLLGSEEEALGRAGKRPIGHDGHHWKLGRGWDSTF